MAGSGLGAKRWNAIADEIAAWALEQSDQLVRELLADGYPPGSQPADDYTQYRTLEALAQSGDPAFWHDLRAQQRLNELQYRFGQPQPLVGQPFAPPLPLNLRGLERASYLAAPGGPGPGLGAPGPAG